MKTVFIGIARMGSTRLPGKVMMEIGGSPVLEWVAEAAYHVRSIDEVCIATSDLPQDDIIAEFCDDVSISCYRGSEDDVLSRFAGAAREAEADIVIRATCDCPFLDPNVISTLIRLRETTQADYVGNVCPPTWPDGLDCEVFTAKALYAADRGASRPIDRSCVTSYILRNRHLFKVENLICPIPGLHKERWVLDTEEDFKLCEIIAGNVKGNSYIDILNFLDANPDLRKLNAHHPRNERFYQALNDEEPVKRFFNISKGLLEDTLPIIPLAAQTFSKSHVQYPEEAPLFLTHGEGGRVFDVDGNEFVDLVGGLLPVVLGHCDPDVDYAIRRQLDRGISLSLATKLEYELASTLTRLIPCAEMVRFGKNGTDVTTAAVRLARAHTGRNWILSSGYHGWADWSVGNDLLRRKGVPPAMAAYTVTFQKDDIEYAKDRLLTERFACCVVEPESHYLKELKHLCELTGTVLVFDEIITGFRWDMGGAQKYYSVIPDLACFGKSMANGMPISAIVGKKEIMRLMEPPNNIFFSGTFFGEALSLAAAIATIAKMEKYNVVENLRCKTVDLAVFADSKNPAVHIVDRLSPLSRLHFTASETGTAEDAAALFRQEMIANGVLIIGSHNFMYAHSDADMERIKKAYAKTFETMDRAQKAGSIKSFIRGGKSISPAANIRAAG